MEVLVYLVERRMAEGSCLDGIDTLMGCLRNFMTLLVSDGVANASFARASENGTRQGKHRAPSAQNKDRDGN